MDRLNSVGRGDRVAWTVVAALAVLLAVTASAAEKERPGAFQLKNDGSAVSIVSSDGAPLVTYAFGGVPFKPYVKELFTPGGVQILRDSPFDHKHHHSLMFALSADGVDFWSETPQCGKQVHRGLNEGHGPLPPGPGTVAFTEEIQWQSPDKKAVLNEKRTITACPDDRPRVSLFTWRTQLTPAEGKASVTLSGAHYVGLGMRFLTSMDKGGRFLLPDGKQGDVVRGTERVGPARWCAYSASAGGKPVTAALFDHPRNARHPAPMFTMTSPFAYLSATLNLWKEPLTISAGKPVALIYGVAAWDGEVEAARIESVYQRWLENVK